ncbi:SxtJ family membrane protein [Planctomycetota bacterium]
MAILDVNWKPTPRELRQFAALFVLFFGGLGTYLFFGRDGGIAVSATLWGLAAVFGVGGLLLPEVARPAYTVLLAVSLPIGMVVSFVVLAMVYYLVLTPIGLIMSLSGYDPMNRRLDPQASTYWTKRVPPSDVRRYFRQY